MNISETGYICLSTLKKEGPDAWSPQFGLAIAVKSILSMLTDPNPDSPLSE